MRRPALAGSLAGGAAALLMVGYFVSHASCASSGPTDPVVGDSTVSCADDVAPLPLPADAAAEAARRPDTAVACADVGPDAEYCPSAAFPPRTDGCPCSVGGGDPTSPFVCTEERLGKICEYTHECPAGLVRRYQCSWVKPMEGTRYVGYVAIEPRECDRPTNDGG